MNSKLCKMTKLNENNINFWNIILKLLVLWNKITIGINNIDSTYKLQFIWMYIQCCNNGIGCSELQFKPSCNLLVSKTFACRIPVSCGRVEYKRSFWGTRNVPSMLRVGSSPLVSRFPWTGKERMWRYEKCCLCSVKTIYYGLQYRVDVQQEHLYYHKNPILMTIVSSCIYFFLYIFVCWK